MPPTILTADGFDLSTVGLIVDSVRDHRNDIRPTYGTKSVPGRIGVVRTSLDPEYKAGKFTVGGTIQASSLAELQTRNDEIKSRVAGRVDKVFTLIDDATRELTGRGEVTITPIQPDMKQTWNKIKIVIIMDDPRVLEDTNTVVGSIGASDTDLPLGTVPSIPTIQVTGSGSFTLTYKDSGGVTIATMAVSGATAPVDIDMGTGVITDAGGNAAEHLTTGGDFPFYFDPEHGVYATAAWPTLACSSGTATATYRKAY